MFAARLVLLRGLPTFVRPVVTPASPALRSTPLKTSQWLTQPYQGYAHKPRFGIRSGKTVRQEIKEAAYEPSLKTAAQFDSMGRLIVAGGAVVGLGALCYYGLGMSNEVGAIEKAVIWPAYVTDRIRSTYMYFAGSISVAAMSAVAISRVPAFMSLMMRGSLLAFGATFAAMIGAGMLVRSISYEQSPVAKHLAWMLHAGVLGAVIAPLTLLGGPLLLRAAWYTTGIVGGLSAVAMCAPSEKFLNMGGPLGIGLGVVLVSCIGSSFLPPTSLFGAGMYSIALYGGLVLCSMFLLYDTQKIVKRAESTPLYGMEKYDPINSSIGIFIDTWNIFIRVATILAGNRRK